MGLFEEVTKDMGDTCDVLPVTGDVVLVVTYEQPTGVFRCTRGQDGSFQLGIILDRGELQEYEATALSEHLVRHAIVWDPEVTAAAYREFLKNNPQ